MSSVYFPSEAAHLHSYACPVVEVVDTISHCGKIQSRSCKRRYEGLQVQPSLLSILARTRVVKLYVQLNVTCICISCIGVVLTWNTSYCRKEAL